MADGISVRIRMYRRGLGDRFLLTFTEQDRTCHMLIDCGALKGTENADQMMREVVSDIRDATNKKLDVLVVTHEHWDHISGFSPPTSTIWDEIDVGEVWMAWTENPNSPEAEGLRTAREATIADLKKISLLPGQKQVLGPGVDALLLFSNEELEDDNRSITRDAMLYAGSKAKGNVQFLDPGTFVKLPNIAGARAYVLGPPKSKELFKDRPSASGGEAYLAGAPPTLADSFFAASAAGLSDQENRDDPRAFPFAEDYHITPGEAQNRAFFRKYYFGDSPGQSAAWRKIDDDWLGVANELALALDSDTNNTSLALAIELAASRHVLLFPGDAQVGSWLTWHSYATWRAHAHDEPDREATAEDLLGRTIFYKVGHHGSHNATLRARGLELMGEQGLVAMIPVDEQLAKKLRWRMPYEPLLNRLIEKTRGRVIRGDTGLPTREQAQALTDVEWQRFRAATVESDNSLYIDYTITA